MNFSKDKFVLSSPYPITELSERLYENTFLKSRLVRVRTKKLFIGEVSEEDFYLMRSSRGGVLCTLNGVFKTEGDKTIIDIETKIHRAFIILFNCWAVFVLAAPALNYMLNAKSGSVSPGEYPVFLLAVVAARLLLHFVYTRVRNKSIKEIEGLIA